MRLIFLLLLPLILVACADTQNTFAPKPEASAEVIEKWVVESADGAIRTFTDEVVLQDYLQVRAARASTMQETCWHYTFDQGTWWVRHCGYSLSEECFYFQGPTGQLVPCGDLGPGGNW